MAQILDAAGTIFFSRELEHVKAKTFDIEYPEFTYDKAFPITNETPAGANTIVYEVYDKRGRAKVIGSNVNDIPRVDVDAKEVRKPVREIADSFGYTIREIEAAQFAGKSLNAKKAIAAREIIEQEQNLITWYGDATAGLDGFFTLVTAGTIPSATAPNGAAASPLWSTKTPLEILADVNAAFTAVLTGTRGVERANMLGLPLAQWDRITTTPMSADNPTTILKFIVDNSPYLQSMDQVMPINELGDIDGAGTDGLMVWNKDPMKCEVEIPMDIQFLEPQLKGLEYEVIARSLFGSINYYKPKSAYVLDGI